MVSDAPEVIVGHGPLTAAIERWKRAAPRSIGVWLETDGREPRHRRDDYRVGELAVVGLAWQDHRAVLPQPDADALRRLAAWWTADPAPYLVFADAHDALFRWQRHAGEAFEPRRFGCIRTATALLGEGRRSFRDLPSFETLAQRMLGCALPESALGGPGPPPAVAARAEALLALMESLTPRLRKRGLVPIHQLECQVLPAVVAMERAGMGVDGAAFQRIADGWQAERRTTQDPERIARLDKLLSTYAYWPREFVRDGRIHPLLHPLATESGRFACSDPNLQQVPSEHTAPGLRNCFTPAAGHGLVIADYAQIELRVAAHLAPCDALRGVFVEGRDPHRVTAATITGKPEAQVSARERQLAKAVNFGFLFGMGAHRFRSYAAASYGVELSDDEARRAKEAFFATYPGIARWHRRVANLERAGQSVVVRTVLGRRKRFPAGKFSFNAALNIPVQGTAAEGFKRAMVALHEHLPRLGARGVLCVHDEYLAEAPSPQLDEARACVEQHMREAMAGVVSSVPIVVAAHVARSWAEKG